MSAFEGIEVDPVDARVMFLTRLALLRPLTAAEALELAQIEAAEKAARQPHEALQ